MELEIVFDGREMTTSVYVKMDAHDELLLSLPTTRHHLLPLISPTLG